MKPLRQIKAVTKDFLRAAKFRDLKREDVALKSYENAIVIGLFSSSSGLGKGARLIYQGLAALGLNPGFVDVTPEFYGSFDTECRLPDQDDGAGHDNAPLIFHINSPEMLSVFEHLGLPKLRNRPRVAVWAWEQEKLPSSWIKNQIYFDEIWASSDFLYRVFTKELSTPVRKFTYPLSRASMHQSNSEKEARPFEFFTSFDNRSDIFRKNPLGVVEAFKMAFLKPDHNVGLTIKVSGISQIDELPNDFRESIDDPRITLLVDHLSQDDYSRLFENIDCIVILSRSEGFGFLAAESVVQGKPLVYSRIPAFDLYKDCPIAFGVAGKVITIKGKSNLYNSKHGLWLDPDIKEAAKIMKQVFEKNKDLKGADKWAKSVFGLLAFERAISQPVTAL